VCVPTTGRNGRTDGRAVKGRHSSFQLNDTTKQHAHQFLFYFFPPTTKIKENLNFIFLFLFKKSAKKIKNKQMNDDFLGITLSIACFIASNYLSSLSLNRIVGA
jgi:hypothetical protein